MNKYRRLHVTIAGRWYLATTVLLGVVALASGNNVVYLIESLLLGALILSGVLAERQIVDAMVEVRRHSASARAPTTDQVIVHNRRKRTLFCLEVGEWRKGKFHPIAFLPRVGPQSSVVVPSTQIFDKRGRHDWDGLAIGTSYPFGFARKLRVIYQGGTRLIWPERADARRTSGDSDSGQASRKQGPHWLEGEVRPMVHGDDARSVVWTLSAKGGEPFVRLRQAERQFPGVLLDLRANSDEAFEKRIVAAARSFHNQDPTGAGGSLILLGAGGRRVVFGREAALDQLALAQLESQESKRAA